MTGTTVIVPQVLVAPGCYPVSLAELRSQLTIETTDDDARLTGLIAAATATAESFLNRALITRTYRGFLDAWPCNRFGGLVRGLELPRAPLVSIDAVATFDDDDVETTWSADDYFADTGSLVGRLITRTTASWPWPTRAANGIRIDWTAGYGPNPGDVPEDIRLGIQVLAGWLNEQRGDEGSPKSWPAAAEALLGPYRILSI